MFDCGRILAATPGGVICLDLDERIEFANPAAARLMGYSQVDEMLNLPIRTHIQFLDPSAPGEELCWRQDGTSFPIEYESVPLDEDGRIVGSVLTFRDISQRRAAEQAKDELASVVSHELRIPLTAIRGSLGLVVSGQLGDLTSKGQRMLEIAVTNTDRLIRLVNDILDLERVDSGKIHMAWIRCDAADLMTQAVDSVRALAEQTRIVLEVVPNDAHVSGDPDRLLQVLINLIGNAIKFSPIGGTIWLDAEESSSELVFRVRDEGRGIPADKLETIFDRFAQVDAADYREKGGTGLGLAICRAIVTQHGGQIWAESTPGAGTTICVALPHTQSELSRDLTAAADAADDDDDADDDVSTAAA